MKVIYDRMPDGVLFALQNAEDLYYFDLETKNVIKKDYTKYNMVFPKVFEGLLESFIYTNEEARIKLEDFKLSQIICSYKEINNRGLSVIMAMWHGLKF